MLTSSLSNDCIIGRKRKLDTLVQQVNDENAAYSAVAFKSMLPPNKRFKTLTKNTKVESGITIAASSQARVFGRNLTNQKNYLQNNNKISNKTQQQQPKWCKNVLPKTLQNGKNCKNTEKQDSKQHTKQHSKQHSKQQAQTSDRATNQASKTQYREWDLLDADNDLRCVDYCNDIMRHLRFSELSQCGFQKKDFIKGQTDITEKMRLTLLDWLCGVHRKFRLVPQVLYLAINLIDRYLAVKQLHRHKLQLLGCACLWIASKYHEIYAPECFDFVYISDGAFTKENLLQMELKIMTALNFELTVATPMSFAQRFSKIGTFAIEKQFVKFAQILFDRYFANTATKMAKTTDHNVTKKMYIKGICDLLDNGLGRSVSKFGSNSSNINNSNNDKNNKTHKFGLHTTLPGIKSEIVEHIGNVFKLCDAFVHCQKTVENSDNATTTKKSTVAQAKEILLKIKKELKSKYGIKSKQEIEHIVTTKSQMQDMLNKMDILCHLVHYLLEHSMLDYQSGLSRVLPSRLAASALAYSLLGCGILTGWPKYLIDETGYDLSLLVPIMKMLDSARQNKKHKAVQSKYSRQQYGRVAQLNFDKMNVKKFFV